MSLPAGSSETEAGAQEGPGDPISAKATYTNIRRYASKLSSPVKIPP